MVFAWTKKEFSNLQKALEIGIRVPSPIAFKNNVLLMEFIGNKDPSPIAKDKPPKNKNKWKNIITEYVEKMEKKGFVHGDLNEFNVINHRERPVLIDWAQSVFRKHPLYEEMLERDKKNLKRWLGNAK